MERGESVKTTYIDVEDTAGLAAVLDSVSRTAEGADYSDLLTEDVVPVLAKEHHEYFANEAGPLGAWEPWHFRLPSMSDSKKTLFSSGDLEKSLDTGAAGHIEEVSPSSLVWGTAIPYAQTHQEGATIRTGVGLVARGGKGFIPAGTEITIPARPFMGTRDQTVDAMADLIADQTVEFLKG